MGPVERMVSPHCLNLKVAACRQGCHEPIDGARRPFKPHPWLKFITLLQIGRGDLIAKPRRT